MILLPALLKSFRSLVDGSINVSFDINIDGPDNIGEIANMLHKVGFMGFQIGENTDKMEKIMKSLPAHDFEEGKTKAQRLRGVLYILWQQNNDGYNVFDDFYNNRMEKLIMQVKSKLE